jgi:uncharacterized protein (TIGR02757 family)
MKIGSKELKSFLDEKTALYNRPEFIPGDPVSVPHLFVEKNDIEITGFLTATIAWGNRTSIINNATGLVRQMDFSPYDFVLHAGEDDMRRFSKFVHRTFNGDDCIYFLKALKNIYHEHDGLEQVFTKPIRDGKTLKESLIRFRKIFFTWKHTVHTLKHVADVEKNASAKRLCMFLRWMVRRDRGNVDFGLWPEISPSLLFCPLDVHSGRVARSLGILTRKSNDWIAVEELTSQLRLLDPSDPAKYDFALFGLGIHEKF